VPSDFAFKSNLRRYNMVVRDTLLMDLYATDASPEDFAARLVSDRGIAPAGSLREATAVGAVARALRAAADAAVRNGGAVQVDTMKPMFPALRVDRLKLICYILHSRFAFKFNLRRCTTGQHRTRHWLRYAALWRRGSGGSAVWNPCRTSRGASSARQGGH